MRKERRLAVVQYSWPLQSYSKDFVLGLANHGYKVDFFVDVGAASRKLVDLGAFNNPGVEVHLLQGFSENSGQSATSSIRRWRSPKGDPSFMLAKSGRLGEFIEYSDLWCTLTAIRRKADEYVAIIGIEKIGLILAGMICGRLNLRLVYYSLELYFEQPAWMPGPVLEWEKRFHSNSVATIVQDPLRAAALLKNNEVTETKVLLLPVSACADHSANTKYWHKLFNLEEHSRVTLFFGVLDSGRHLEELILQWSNCGSNNYLILHGYGYGFERELRRLCVQLGLKNVFISTDLVPDTRVAELIASADIG